MNEKMLVTEGLNELKTLNARIMRDIQKAEFIVGAKNVEKNAKPGKTKEDFSKEAKASMQSIEDLIARRERIKAAIIASNAVTEVEIAGQKMTVAKAIETKDSITYKQMLLEIMEEQYKKAVELVDKKNRAVDEKIDDLVATAYGKEGKEKVSENDYEAIAKPYKAANEYGFVDPLDLKKRIDDLHSFIDEFKSTVDSKLQISNCITVIEI